MIISKSIFPDQDGVTSNTNCATQSMDGLLLTRPGRLNLLIVANRLCIDRDLYGVPDDDTSSVEHRIPTYSEIMPVNDRFRRETGAGFRALVDPPSRGVCHSPKYCTFKAVRRVTPRIVRSPETM